MQHFCPYKLSIVAPAPIIFNAVSASRLFTFVENIQ